MWSEPLPWFYATGFEPISGPLVWIHGLQLVFRMCVASERGIISVCNNCSDHSTISCSSWKLSVAPGSHLAISAMWADLKSPQEAASSTYRQSQNIPIFWNVRIDGGGCQRILTYWWVKTINFSSASNGHIPHTLGRPCCVQELREALFHFPAFSWCSRIGCV